LAKNAHLSNALILGSHVTAVPKGYLYFAISFSLFIEVLNMKASKKNKYKNRTLIKKPHCGSFF
jgi:predicted tellurium resistance membrane protein TerC